VRTKDQINLTVFVNVSPLCVKYNFIYLVTFIVPVKLLTNNYGKWIWSQTG